MILLCSNTRCTLRKEKRSKNTFTKLCIVHLVWGKGSKTWICVLFWIYFPFSMSSLLLMFSTKNVVKKQKRKKFTLKFSICIYIVEVLRLNAIAKVFQFGSWSAFWNRIFSVSSVYFCFKACFWNLLFIFYFIMLLCKKHYEIWWSLWLN